MASVSECREALRVVAARLAADQEAREKISLDRTLACHIRDLDVYFHCRLAGSEFVGISDGDDPNAQIRVALDSDDLLALVRGDLHFARAWASGRLSVRASFGDLLKLRKLA